MTNRRPKKNGPTNQREAQKALVKKHGKGYMAELARRGGTATRDKRGPDFFREISRKGVERRRQIREAGLRALEGK